MKIRRVLLTMMLLLFTISAISLPVYAKDIPGSPNTWLLQSRLATSESGLYALLQGQVYYYDYQTSDAVWLRDVDLVDDTYQGQIYQTPDRYERYYEMAESFAAMFYYDDHVWILLSRQEAGKMDAQLILRQFDPAMETGRDYLLPQNIRRPTSSILHHDKLFFIDSEDLPLGDGSLLERRFLSSFDLSTGEVSELMPDHQCRNFTINDNMLVVLAKPNDENLADYSDFMDFVLANRDVPGEIYLYDIADAEFQQQNFSGLFDWPIRIGDWLVYNEIILADRESKETENQEFVRAFNLLNEDAKLLAEDASGFFVRDGSTLAWQTSRTTQEGEQEFLVTLLDDGLNEIYIYSYACINPSRSLYFAGHDRGRLFFIESEIKDYVEYQRAVYMIDSNESAPELRKIISTEP